MSWVFFVGGPFSGVVKLASFKKVNFQILHGNQVTLSGQ